MKKTLLYLLIMISATSFAQLSGTYTIGGTSPDYATINDAVTALNTDGVSGTVTFNIRTGTYNESVTVPFIVGNTSANKITFQSESGNPDDVVIENSLDIFLLDSIMNINFSNLTFNTTSGTGTAITSINKNNNITVSDCKFYLNTNSAGFGIHIEGGIDGRYATDSLFVYNNYFEGGAYAVFSQGNDDCYMKYAKIEGNTMINQRYMANCFYKIGNEYDATGALIGNAGGLIVRNNIMILDNDAYNSYQKSLYANKVYNMLEISGNYMKIYSETVSNVEGFRSIYNNGIVDSVEFYNNIIDIYVPNASCNAIVTVSGSGHKYINNTVMLKADSSGYSAAFLYYYSNNYRLVNNNFINLSEGSQSSIFYINQDYSAGYLTNLDYNNYYTNGDLFSRWNDNNILTFTEHQTETGVDVHSLNTASSFAMNNDYIASACGSIFGQGIPIPGITNDYNKIARSSTAPSIGAIEAETTVFNPLFASATILEQCGTIINDTLISIINYSNGYFTWTSIGFDAITLNEKTNVDSILSSTTFTLKWLDGICVNPKTVNVIVKTIPTPSIVGGTEYCVGNNISLSSDSTYTSYSWSNGNTTQSDNFTVTDNPITLTVIATNGCEGTSTEINLVENSLPTPTITGDTEYCAGNNISLSSNNIYNSYLWSNGSTTQTDNFTVADNPITLTVIDANGCEGTSTDINLVEDALPIVNLGNDTILCEDASYTLSAGTGFTYLWSTGETTETITVDTSSLGNGVSQVYVIVTNGTCETIDTIQISFSNCTGIKQTEQLSLNVYPNPASNNIQLTISNEQLLGSTGKILDITGKIVFSFILQRTKQSINVSDLQNGVYFLKIDNQTIKFIKN